MIKTILIAAIILLISQSAFYSQNEAVKEAFLYLNKVRANPSLYSKEVGVSLSGIKARHALKWNDTLAKVAQAKAEDLAKNNYFDHVDLKGFGLNYYVAKAGYKLPEGWLSDPSANYVESLSAGSASPKGGIIQLLNDNDEPVHNKAGHRVHLLGIDDFFGKGVDVGIGWASDTESEYSNYLVVVIARHTW
jgi:uncharacterized protein YkwD